MAESLLGLGELSGQALNLARLSQLQERVDLSGERLEFARQKERQDMANDRIHALSKIGENELVPTDIRLKVTGHILKALDPSLTFTDDELTSGYRAVINASKLAIDPTIDPDEKIKAWDAAAISVPGLASKLQAIQEKTGTVDERRAKLYGEIQLQNLKIRDLKHQQDQIEIRDGVYATAGGMLTQGVDSTTIQDADKKRSFDPIFKRALHAKDDTERKLILAGSKDLEEAFRTKIHGVQQAATMQFAQWRNELGPLKGAVEQAKAEGRAVEKEDLEKVAALELVTKAEDDLNAWVGQPYDKKAWNRLQTTLQQVKIAQSGTKQALRGLDGTRMEMLKNAERKTNLDYAKEQTKIEGTRHLADLQQQFASLPDAAQSPQKAAALIKQSGYKDVNVDDVLLANPLKFKKAAAEVTINQNSPTERKDVAEARSQLDALDNIEHLYDPGFVGPVDSRLGRIKSLTGVIKDQEAEFRSGVKLMRAELRKFYFGTAQSKQELTGALEAMPDIDMSDAQFRAAMKETRRNVTSGLGRRIESMEQSNVRAPKGKSLGDRYKEIEQGGKLTKDQIFQQLKNEGYR
jgi:hypothetical protein